MSTIFPTVAKSEIPVWFHMQAHQPVNDMEEIGLGAMDKDKFGSAIEGASFFIQAPTTLLFGDRQRYKTINLKTVAAAASMGGQVGDVADVGGFMSTIMGGLVQAAGGAAEGLNLPVLGDIAQTTAFMDQKSLNPREQLMFESPDFRSFTASWELGITESEDAAALENIIKLVRKYSYPKITGPFYYEIPKQWSISLVADTEKGPSKIDNFGKCIIESMNTNYTGAGFLSINSGGKPAFINLELTFKEVRLRHGDSSEFAGGEFIAGQN